jgi:hypothetical protein
VTPAAGANRLLVTVDLPASAPWVTGDLARERLERAAGLLRCAVAAAIRRRRAPELAFHIVRAGPAMDEGRGD